MRKSIGAIGSVVSLIGVLMLVAACGSSAGTPTPGASGSSSGSLSGTSTQSTNLGGTSASGLSSTPTSSVSGTSAGSLTGTSVGGLGGASNGAAGGCPAGLVQQMQAQLQANSGSAGSTSATAASTSASGLSGSTVGSTGSSSSTTGSSSSATMAATMASTSASGLSGTTVGGAGNAAASGPVCLVANMTGPEEVPPGAPQGRGFAAITLDPTTGSVTFDVVVTGINLPATAMHIHKGNPGVAGPIVIPASKAPDSTGLINTTTQNVDANLIAQVIANPAQYYVNVHTTDFPGGAVRGTLRPYNPAEFSSLGAAGSVGSTNSTGSTGGSANPAPTAAATSY